MNIVKWFKRKSAILVLAMSNVEKNAFSQNTEGLSKAISQERRNTQGNVLDDLKQGKITTEVRELRWRMYKIMNASDNLVTEITGYDENDLPITKTTRVNKTRGLEKIKVDSFDSYPLEMVINNDEITLSTSDS